MAASTILFVPLKIFLVIEKNIDLAPLSASLSPDNLLTNLLNLFRRWIPEQAGRESSAGFVNLSASTDGPYEGEQMHHFKLIVIIAITFTVLLYLANNTPYGKLVGQ